MESDSSTFVPAWNSHVAVIAHVCSAAGLDWDLVDVAGVTGAAFRIALCEGATPPSLYHTWSFGQYFTLWLGALGIDAAVTWHPASAPGAQQWLARARESVAHSLGAGFPVIYWDNLAFSVITGREGNHFNSAGIARDMVHPDLASPAIRGPYLSRLSSPDSPGPFMLSLDHDELCGGVNDDLFFACPRGVYGVNREGAVLEGIVRLAWELSGRLEYPRRYDPPGFSCNALYGLPALARLIDELEAGRAHHFGLVQFIQAQTEGRRWGIYFLKRVAPTLPADFAPRVSQAAEFFTRAARHWGVLARRWSPPLDPATQASRDSQRECAEELYQIHKTEETARRLLASVADEIVGG